MIAVMIRDYCGRVGVEVAEPSAPSVVRQPPAKSKRAGPKDHESGTSMPRVFESIENQRLSALKKLCKLPGARILT